MKELVDERRSARPARSSSCSRPGTDAEWYEEELRAAGLPTYRATGRGYFGQQQVVDLLAYLRLLQNRYDDEALVTVLASPFVGVSNDALAAAAAGGAQRPLFTGLERSLPADLGERDAQLLRAFRQRYERLAEAVRAALRSSGSASGSSPTTTTTSRCSRSGTGAAATRTCASSRGSRARTRSCAAPTSRASSASSSEQEAVGAAERDAVAEEEGADAVRLLTIHAAKGLEFKVVVVADAGRDRNAPAADEILCLSDGRFGFRVADPATGKRHGVLGYESVKDARRAEDDAERLRLYYVAMTRAIDRLIVSGSIDSQRRADEKTPIGWVLSRLDCAAELEHAGEGPVELEREGARVLLRLDRAAEPAASSEDRAAAADEPEVEEPGQLALFAVTDAGVAAPLAPALAPIQALPEPPLHDVRRLSYSALALFERCSYRYYAERVAGMRPADAHGTVPGQSGLAATEVGDAVHRLLELVDLAAPVPPEVEQVRGVVPGRDGGGTGADRRRSSPRTATRSSPAGSPGCPALARSAPSRSSTTASSCTAGSTSCTATGRGRSSSTTRRTRSTRARRRRSSSRTTGSSGSSTRLRASGPARRRSRSSTTSWSGRTRSSRPRSSGRRCPRSRLELSEAIARIRAGEFRPTPSEFVCSGCPALDLVCAGPRLRGGPTRSPALAAAG